jgi:hypothetical protein
MTLRDLNAQTRRRLRRHAWLLTLWCLAVGLATSLLLLHVFAVRLPAARYGIVAIVMYSLGLVVGARVWLVHFSRSVQSEATLRARATPDEIAEFDNERATKEQQARRPSGGFQWLDLLSGVGDFISFDEASALLIVPAVIVAIVGALLLTGVIPALVMDGVTGLLAEVAVQFVFGALIARRVIGPVSHDAAFMTIVGRTWLAGLVFVVVSLAAGYVLQQLNPGGATIADLFR